MTNAIIDTCALIWLLQGSHRLGEDAQAVIEDSGVRKLVSPVSYWEVATKSSMPKHKGNEVLRQENYKEVISALLEEFQIEVLHFTLDHTEHLYAMEYFQDHKDPCDRIIVAKAIVEGASLISSDGKLYYYGFEEKFKNVWTLTDA